jgi:tRNA(Arg) A34 adenosine deaminase TadA
VVASLGGATLQASASLAAAPKLGAIPLATHEKAMREAINEAHGNPAFPFGAVIVRGDTGEIVARGINNTAANPTFHGEIVAMHHYVERNGNKGWDAMILYTTGEPCPMCMSALAWAGLGGVVFGSSIDTIRRSGIRQIDITAKSVIEAAPFYHGELLGGVLQPDTDQLFLQRKRS